MSKGTAVAVIALAAYLGFEAYAIKKAAHRTEPSYIFTMLVDTQAAARLCDFGDAQLKDKFERTLARVRQQYANELVEDAKFANVEQAEQQLEAETGEAGARVAEILERVDCSDQQMKDYFQRYRIYARRSK